MNNFVSIREIRFTLIQIKIRQTRDILARKALEDLLERAECFWIEADRLPPIDRRLYLNDIKSWIEVAEDEVQYVPVLTEAFATAGLGKYVTGPYLGNKKGFALALKGLYHDLRI